jgi:hypothetical protein
MSKNILKVSLAGEQTMVVFGFYVCSVYLLSNSGSPTFPKNVFRSSN